MKKASGHWATISESGSYRGILFMLWLYRLFGRKFFSVILGPVCLYFFLVNGTARRSSLEFLHRHAKQYPAFWQRPPGYRDVLRHIYSFGQAILDKMLAWSEDIDPNCFLIQNQPVLDEFLSRTGGQLIIGSHLGNLEFCRGFMQRYMDKTINVLVYDQHSANFVEAMQKINPVSRFNVYQVTQLDIPTILLLQNKIQSGEWLFIAGDRVPISSDRTLEADFLGDKAPFAIGPYILAKTLQCQVTLMFSYRVAKGVNFEVVPFADKVVLPRGDATALQAYIQRYATELERQAAKAPLQWFNFYPYWVKQS